MSKVKGLFRRGRKWWLRHTPVRGGKQVRVPLNTESEDVAAVMALQMMQEAPLQQAGDFAGEVVAYVKEARERETLSGTFAPTRRCMLEAFARDMSVSRVEDVTTKLVADWMVVLRRPKNQDGRGCKPETIRSYVYHLRAFYRWLMKKHKLRVNPAAGIELGKPVRTWRKDFVVTATVRKLIAEAPDDDLRFILFCGMQEGFRKLEIVEAVPAWFRLGTGPRRGCIVIGQTETFKPKDRDERTIPLTTEFEQFLRRYLAALPADARWVLRPEKRHRKHRYRYDFRKPFADYMKAQGVKCTAHDMRRSFVSNKLIENGALLPKLAKWTGDDVKTMMDHYAHLLADDDDIDAGL